jgi:YVTN family beta-propeller protein
MRLTRIIIISTCLLSASLIAVASDLQQIGMVGVPGAPGFGELAFANGMLLITRPRGSSVDVFDPVRRHVVAEITGLQSPRDVAVDEQGGKIYVADHGSNSIAIVAPATWKVVDSIPLPGAPDKVLLDGAGKIYWSDTDNGTISVVDLRTKQNLGTVDVGGTPHSLALGTDHGVVFATVQDQHQVIAVDPQLKIVNRFNLNASQPTGLVYDPRYRQLYVSVRFAVLAISADTGAETDRVAAPAGVDALWLDPETRTVYAASNGSLLTLHATGKLVAVEEIPTDVKGHTVAYDAAKRLVLLPGGREGKSKVMIWRINSSTESANPRDTQAAVH